MKNIWTWVIIALAIIGGAVAYRTLRTNYQRNELRKWFSSLNQRQTEVRFDLTGLDQMTANQIELLYDYLIKGKLLTLNQKQIAGLEAVLNRSLV